jgi:hypothetical protein
LRSPKLPGGCADISGPIRAALDAGDVARAARLLRERPDCPVAVETDVYRLAPLDGPSIPGIYGDCPACDAIFEVLSNHPLARRLVDALRQGGSRG